MCGQHFRIILCGKNGDLLTQILFQLMLFTFAGSTHSKYTSYLLEMICNFELESSPELREVFFENYLVNPSGLPGHWIAGDLYQEQLQDELYEHIGRKDKGFDESYVQNVIAPNVHRFIRVKKDVNEGLGLKKRSGNHAEPHANPEIRKLLEVYELVELHSFRKGRTYGGEKDRVDHYGKGISRLNGGKLQAWINESLQARGFESTGRSRRDTGRNCKTGGRLR